MFDLKLCMNCSEAKFIDKFGKVPHFDKLESILRKLKATNKPLSYGYLRKIASTKYWNFNEFWMIPSWWGYFKKRNKTSGLFRTIPENERQVIWDLYQIFKNIEVVSIILRLIDPKNYGIISPPVRSALRLHARDNYVDEYLDYLSVLRAYAKEYEFIRVSDTEIALWTLVLKCIRHKGPECKNFLEYQVRLIETEEQIIRNSQLFEKLEKEAIEILETDSARQDELNRLKDEISKLSRERRTFPFDLIKLEKSTVQPNNKIVHDKNEPDVDAGQKYFMKKLADIPVVNQIIWSENITAKGHTRISSIQERGELTILYVNRNNYAAKLKVRPVHCPDVTHGRFFAQIVAREMNIELCEKKFEN